MNSQHYFVATNLLLKYKISQLVCFFYIQYTGELLMYIRNPVLKLRVTMYPEWSASNLNVIKEPKSCGSGMFDGISSLSETWPNLLEVQYCCPNSSWSITWSLGSSTNLELWYCFSYTNTWWSCSICPSHGSARRINIIEISRHISILPSSTIYLKTPISDWYYTPSSDLIYGDISSSVWYDVCICVLSFTGNLMLFSFKYPYTLSTLSLT